MKRLALLAIAATAVACGLPGMSVAATLPATVTGGTAHLKTTDWCYYYSNVVPPAGKRRWVDQITLDLVVRVDGQQRRVSLSSSPGPHYMYCSSWTLPGMTFTGTSSVGTSATQESTSGWCRGLDGPVYNFECTLSFVGNAPAVIKMRLTSAYQQCDGEGSAVPGPCYDTNLVTGAQLQEPQA